MLTLFPDARDERNHGELFRRRWWGLATAKQTEQTKQTEPTDKSKMIVKLFLMLPLPYFYSNQ